MRRSFFLALTLIAALLSAASEAPAQNAAGVKARGSSRAPAAPAAPAAPMSEAALGERMNANTVAVVSGTPGGTYFRMASDMAFVLDDGDDLRILPILGKGAGQNAYDIRFLKGVDLGFVRTDTLDQLREDKRLTNVDRHITYIARLFNDELHVIAPREVTDSGSSPARKSASTSRAAAPTIPGARCSRASVSISRR